MTVPNTTATDKAVAAAKDAPELVSILQTANPALYAKLTGSLATYSKSDTAPVSLRKSNTGCRSLKRCNPRSSPPDRLKIHCRFFDCSTASRIAQETVRKNLQIVFDLLW